MTMDGETIAASNYDCPVSFVGENFTYRPLFPGGGAGQPVALLCARHDVAEARLLFRLADRDRRRDPRRHRLQGRYRQHRGRPGAAATTGFSSPIPEGIIFMTGSPEWLYASILPLTPERRRPHRGVAALCGCEAARTAGSARHGRRPRRDDDPPMAVPRSEYLVAVAVRCRMPAGPSTC